VCVRIAEGKVAADHSEEDDSTAPEVSLDGVISDFSFDDLRGSVAGGAAKGLEFFILGKA
jgi:hypothetical protein